MRRLVHRLRVRNSVGNVRSSFHSAGNAIWNSGAVVGRTGKMQSRMPCGEAFNFGDARAVAHVILRIRFRPAIGLGQHRLRVDTHDGAQFLASQLDQGSIVSLCQMFCAVAADENAN
jgi:hypothetical protein